jgi:SulP family sulfate permease
VIGGFLVSALGGSRVQIGGPAGAFIVIIYGIVEKYGVANLLIATVFAGMMLCAMGVFRLGSLIRYIPVPIVIGFTSGIAVLIALSQMKDFFGLHIEKMPGDFFAQVQTLAQNFASFNLTSIIIGVLLHGRSCLNPRLPNSSHHSATATTVYAVCCVPYPAPSSCWCWRHWQSACLT